MKRWTTVGEDDPIKVGDTLAFNKKDLWKVTNVKDFGRNIRFVNIKLIHR